MIFLFSLGVLCFVLFIVAVQIDFYNALQKDRFRFACVALSDRLSLLVANGSTVAQRNEFKKIDEAVRIYLNAVEKISIHEVGKSLREVERLERHVDDLAMFKQGYAV